MKQIIISGLLATATLVATPVFAQTNSLEQTEVVSDIDPLSSDKAWNESIDNGTTDVALFKRREVAPGVFPTRIEMKSLVERGCFVGGDVISSNPKIARMLAAGQQCTEDFRKEVNKLKKAGSTTFYVHQMMFGYSIRIDKRGSKEQGNSTCDGFSPFNSIDAIPFSCFNDKSGHQRVAGFAEVIGQTAVAGGVNFALMRAQRRNRTIVDNRSGSQAGAQSTSESAGGGTAPAIHITNNPLFNPSFNVNAGAEANINEAPCRSTTTPTHTCN